MVRRRISDDLKEVALSLSLHGLPDLEVCEYTGLSEPSLKRLRKIYRELGKVSHSLPNEGRPRMLTAMEVKVRHRFLEAGHSLTLTIYSFSLIASIASPT